MLHSQEPQLDIDKCRHRRRMGLERYRRKVAKVEQKVGIQATG